MPETRYLEFEADSGFLFLVTDLDGTIRRRTLAVIDREVDPETFEALVNHPRLPPAAWSSSAETGSWPEIRFPGGLSRQVVGRDNSPKALRALELLEDFFPNWTNQKRVRFMRLMREMTRR